MRLSGQVPAAGPVILVANHPNGLVDPVLVALQTPRLVSFLGKAPLFKMPVLGWVMQSIGSLPVYRLQDNPGEQEKNELTFAACSGALRRDAAICIFPEGVSHSEPALQRLKTGAARIALKAEEAAGFDLGVQIVPIGLTYVDKHLFRGQVAVEIGNPIPVRSFEELYRAEPRLAVEELTAKIGEELGRITLNLESWEDRPVLEAAEAILAGDKGWSADPADRHRRIRVFAEELRSLRNRDPGQVSALESQIFSFREQLASLGANVEDLDAHHSLGRIGRFLLRGLLILAAFPAAVAGSLFFYPPYLIPRWYTNRARTELDVIASVKIGVSLLVFPAWMAIWTVAAGWWLGWPLALGGLLTLPWLGWFAVHYWERWERSLEDLAIFLRFGLSGSRKRHWLARRAELARRIEGLAGRSL